MCRNVPKVRALLLSLIEIRKLILTSVWMSRAAPSCFHSSMLPWHPEHALWLRLSTSGLSMTCLLTSPAIFYHRPPCSSHSYYSGPFLLQERTIRVLASGPLNLLFSWLGTLPPGVIPVHSITFSGSNIASLSHLNSLHPTLYSSLPSSATGRFYGYLLFFSSFP